MTYYFSDCQPGASPKCIAGNNANSGTSPDSPKRDLTGLNLVASDSYLFARGGAWVNFSLRVFLPQSSKENPTIFADYTPRWAGSSAPRPLMVVGIDGVGIKFEDAGNADQDEGYLVRQLELRGTSNTGKGISVFNDADHITVEGVVIDGFAIGVHVSGSNAPNQGSDGESSYFKLKNSVVKNNSTQGFLGAGPFLLIENSTFDNNGFRQEILDHNIYVSREGPNVTIRGNVLTRNARVDGGPCKSVSLVAHGYHPNMLVENNFIYEDRVSRSCYGIDLNANAVGSTKPQDFSNLIVRGNRIVFADPVESPGLGIGCSSCPGAIIENNSIVVLGQKGTVTGIAIPSINTINMLRGDVSDNRASVRNNSIYINSSSTGATGIRLSRPEATNEVIVSNVVVFGPVSSASSRCFNHGSRSASSFDATGNNLCFSAAGPNRWSDVLNSLVEAQSSGFDIGSRIDNPLITDAPSERNGWIMSFAEGSPAINGGHSSKSAGVDIAGRQRDIRPDIGAHEWISIPTTTPSKPAPPRKLRVH